MEQFLGLILIFTIIKSCVFHPYKRLRMKLKKRAQRALNKFNHRSTNLLEPRNSCWKCYNAPCQFLPPFPLSNYVMPCLTWPSNLLLWLGLGHQCIKLRPIFHHIKLRGRFKCDWFNNWGIKREKVCGGGGGGGGGWWDTWWWWSFQRLDGVGAVAFVESAATRIIKANCLIKGHSAVGGAGAADVFSLRWQVFWLLLKDLS